MHIYIYFDSKTLIAYRATTYHRHAKQQSAQGKKSISLIKIEKSKKRERERERDFTGSVGGDGAHEIGVP